MDLPAALMSRSSSARFGDRRDSGATTISATCRRSHPTCRECRLPRNAARRRLGIDVERLTGVAGGILLQRHGSTMIVRDGPETTTRAPLGSRGEGGIQPRQTPPCSALTCPYKGPSTLASVHTMAT